MWGRRAACEAALLRLHDAVGGTGAGRGSKADRPGAARLMPHECGIAATSGCPTTHLQILENSAAPPALIPRMAYYRRRLPHFDVIGNPVFVTFRLHGSLPANRAFARDRPATDGRVFAAMDRLLDKSDIGPLYLRRPDIASIVAAALRRGEAELGQYELHAYAVMPNHVHVLAIPSVAAARWLGPLKGSTAREANRILRRAGERFWQDESYDHLVRDGEFERIRRYIEWNPVVAGLARAPEEFPWSSATAGVGAE